MPRSSSILFARAIALLLALIFAAFALGACREDKDENETTNAEKREIFCEKIGACEFDDELQIDECLNWAEELSDWLMDCSLQSKGCRELAECFNIDEGATPGQ